MNSIALARSGHRVPEQVLNKNNGRPVNSQKAANSCIDNRVLNKLAKWLSTEEQTRLEKIIDKPFTLYRGKHLFRQNAGFQNLYTLRSGCIKNYITDKNGGERIISFSLPGEILALDAIADKSYKYSAIVLEDASIQRIPYQSLNRLGVLIPHLQFNLLHIFSEEINLAHERRSMFANKSAEEKLAIFLLDFLERKHCIEDRKMELWLRMGRYDIANYLGLASETVSRVLTRLRDDGTLQVENRNIRIVNYPRLWSIAYGRPESSSGKNVIPDSLCAQAV